MTQKQSRCQLPVHVCCTSGQHTKECAIKIDLNNKSLLLWFVGTILQHLYKAPPKDSDPILDDCDRLAAIIDKVLDNIDNPISFPAVTKDSLSGDGKMFKCPRCSSTVRTTSWASHCATFRGHGIRNAVLLATRSNVEGNGGVGKFVDGKRMTGICHAGLLAARKKKSCLLVVAYLQYMKLLIPFKFELDIPRAQAELKILKPLVKVAVRAIFHNLRKSDKLHLCQSASESMGDDKGLRVMMEAEVWPHVMECIIAQSDAQSMGESSGMGIVEDEGDATCSKSPAISAATFSSSAQVSSHGRDRGEKDSGIDLLKREDNCSPELMPSSPPPNDLHDQPKRRLPTISSPVISSAEAVASSTPHRPGYRKPNPDSIPADVSNLSLVQVKEELGEMRYKLTQLQEDFTQIAIIVLRLTKSLPQLPSISLPLPDDPTTLTLRDDLINLTNLLDVRLPANSLSTLSSLESSHHELEATNPADASGTRLDLKRAYLSMEDPLPPPESKRYKQSQPTG
ncbi:hypothetical protein CALVIDRAFT_603466 [Calocera viscosa TUFC12733]|uniref:Uncharacterized protein n=1 Tax=Calocera viscosa (strain TUFC12733) TaxID=1330018 RepID=A0A167FPL3_CALVF|nr:hypothetical protein CALVIDRAFT_603466 [Calocera viscosa TUFC12733]